ncbi:MAG: 2,3,4,5-tetrahydropyridine-2,6-dicarboxylate N-acetyltransferase, partial [Ignavibacteria bacterium]|nr:2,3,4,5-tetrahydropyridine-2,6-dicarboxylate N-acetyltransferase [Ignavibacteria bacterium]
MDSYEVIRKISEAKKKTPAKVYLQGELDKIDFGDLDFFGSSVSGILFCENSEYQDFIKKNKKFISKHKVEIDRRNSAIPMADLSKYNCRIEPGAIIRDMVEIGDNCVIMMGAVLNIGAVIGERTMI